jgi:hypothetical protein
MIEKIKNYIKRKIDISNLSWVYLIPLVAIWVAHGQHLVSFFSILMSYLGILLVSLFSAHISPIFLNFTKKKEPEDYEITEKVGKLLFTSTLIGITFFSVLKINSDQKKDYLLKECATELQYYIDDGEISSYDSSLSKNSDLIDIMNYCNNEFYIYEEPQEYEY